MTLTEFLLARLDEDEAMAYGAGPDGGEWFSRHPEQPELHMYGEFGWMVSGPNVESEDSDWGRSVADHIARHDPARVLAECEAKRRLISEILGDGEGVDGEWGDGHSADEIREGRCSDHGASHVRDRLAILAAIYSDHPDYDQAWRP